VAGQYSVFELIPSRSRNQKQRRDAKIIPGSARHPVFTAKTQRHEEDKDAPRSCPCESSCLRVFVVRFFWLRLCRATFIRGFVILLVVRGIRGDVFEGCRLRVSVELKAKRRARSSFNSQLAPQLIGQRAHQLKAE